MGLIGTVGAAVVMGAGVGAVGRGVGIVGAGVGIVGLGVGIVGRGVGSGNVGGTVGAGGGVGFEDGSGGMAGFRFPEMVGREFPEFPVFAVVPGFAAVAVIGAGVLIAGDGTAGTTGDGVRTNMTGAGVLMIITGFIVGRGVGLGVGSVGAGVGTVGLGVGSGTVGAGVVVVVGAGVSKTGAGVTGAGVTGGAAGIAPADPCGAQGIPGDAASNLTSQPMHAPGAQVSDSRATSKPVMNWVLTHEL